MDNNKFNNSPKIKAKILKVIKSPYILVAPAFLFYLIFWAYPVLTAIYEVFTKTSSEGGGFTLNNIVALVNEVHFSEALVNSLVFAIVSIILQFVLALLLALLINRKFKGSNLFLFFMMLPMAIPIASVGIIWNTGLTEFGWINSLLEVTGLQNILELVGLADGPIIWTTVSGMKAVMFLILVDTWTVLPSVMIIILAGLQNLNKEYQEVAMVFGATKRQTITDIVIPIIKPTIITALLLRIISGIQIWLLSVMIFGFNKVPFLVERIVYYTKFYYSDESADKLAFTYSVLVIIIVMTMAVLFLQANKKSERSLNNG